jgi:pimeloyl-ACP methyl ester carboxylesterase
MAWKDKLSFHASHNVTAITFPEDVLQNQNYSKTKLPMPVLALGGGYEPALGGNVTTNYPLYGMKILAQNAHGIILPNTGHWIPLEQPDFVAKSLNNFFSGNSTTEASK